MKEMEQANKTNSYIAVGIAIVLVIGLAVYTQYKIGATNSALESVAVTMATAKQGSSQQTAQVGVSPQLGITYDMQGYDKMLNYYNTIDLTGEQGKIVAGLNVELPCCGFTNILTNSDGTANFADSCHCGHHDAMYGLAKYMVQNGYSREEIQKELNAWKEVFFPTQGGGNLGGCA